MGRYNFHTYHPLWAWCQKGFQMFKHQNGTSGQVLKLCADLLVLVFTMIFELFLDQSVIPTCFKSNIIPVPKKTGPACLNDCCPVALTPAVMKCFEWLTSARHYPAHWTQYSLPTIPTNQQKWVQHTFSSPPYFTCMRKGTMWDCCALTAVKHSRP